MLEEHTSRLMSLPGVVGTALGERDGRPCIVVLVANTTAALLDALPGELGGYPVAVEETGELRALHPA